MRKRIILLTLIFLFIALASVQAIEDNSEIPAIVTDRLAIQFHAVRAGETISLNLPKYFGRKTTFYVSQTEHVNVTIDQDTGIATLSAFDPEWRGTEEIVFATSKEALTKTEPGRYVQRKRNLSLLNLSVDKIVMPNDAFTEQQLRTILGNLTSEAINISTLLGNSTLLLKINDEVNINLSFSPDRPTPYPEIDFDFNLKSTNLTRAHYREPNQMLYFTIFLLGVAVVIVVMIYIKTTYHRELKEILLAPRKKVSVSRIPGYKHDLQKKLNKLRARVENERPSKIYRETLLAMNRFLLKAFRVKGFDMTAIEQKLNRYGVSPGTKAKIKAYLTDYRGKVYTANEIGKSDVHNLIAFIESILNNI